MRSVDLKVHLDDDGTPRGATAREKLNVPLGRLWDVIVDVDRFPGRGELDVAVGLLESMRKAAGG